MRLFAIAKQGEQSPNSLLDLVGHGHDAAHTAQELDGYLRVNGGANVVQQLMQDNPWNAYSR